MDDLISREAVLEATSAKLKITGKENAETVYKYIKKLCDDIKALPSAQKKGHWIVVTRHEHYPSGKPYEQLQCPFCKRFDHNGDGSFCGYCGAELTESESVLSTLPSAQKRGHWVKNHDSDHAWKCSECGCGYTDSKLSFCYDCGADMRAEAKE